MTTASIDLEQLAARIHKLIEPSGAIVEWNQKERDPDTGRLRQIDAKIIRDGKTIHVECRDHRDPQDVKWIEELIGRRLSLRVDGIIAVSTSGFSGPAVAKAKAFGILVRSLSEMTDAEIQAWGKTAKVLINYIEISELELSPYINAKDIPGVSDAPEFIFPAPYSPVLAILERVSQQTHDKFFKDRQTTVTLTAKFQDLYVDRAPVIKVDVKLKGRLRQSEVRLLSVWNYHGAEPFSPSEATVSKHDFGSTEIIQSKDTASMILDFSVISPPKNCHLQTFQVDFGRVVHAHFEVLGLPKTINIDIDSILDVKAVDFDSFDGAAA